MKKQLFLLITLLATTRSTFCAATCSEGSPDITVSEEGFDRFLVLENRKHTYALYRDPDYTNSIPPHKNTSEGWDLKNEKFSLTHSANALAHNAVTDGKLSADQVAGCFITDELAYYCPCYEVLSLTKALFLLNAQRDFPDCYRLAPVVSEYAAHAKAAHGTYEIYAKKAIDAFVEFLRTADSPELDELDIFLKEGIKSVAAACQTKKIFAAHVIENAHEVYQRPQHAIQTTLLEKPERYVLTSLDQRTYAVHEGVGGFHRPYLKHQVVIHEQ